MLKDFTLSLELEPTENRVVQTAAIFWSHDVNTAKIYIELLRKGTPIILNKNVTVRVMMLFDDENKSEHIYTAKIEDELKGLVSITLEESMRMYVGQVTAGVYLEYGNEEKTDNGYFTFGMRRSLIDKDMPDLKKMYVSDFEDALKEIEEFKGDIDKNIDDMLTKFDNGYIETEQKLREIELQVKDLDVVNREDFNELKEVVGRIDITKFREGENISLQEKINILTLNGDKIFVPRGEYTIYDLEIPDKADIKLSKDAIITIKGQVVNNKKKINKSFITDAYVSSEMSVKVESTEGFTVGDRIIIYNGGWYDESKWIEEAHNEDSNYARYEFNYINSIGENEIILRTPIRYDKAVGKSSKAYVETHSSSENLVIEGGFFVIEEGGAIKFDRISNCIFANIFINNENKAVDTLFIERDFNSIFKNINAKSQNNSFIWLARGSEGTAILNNRWEGIALFKRDSTILSYYSNYKTLIINNELKLKGLNEDTVFLAGITTHTETELNLIEGNTISGFKAGIASYYSARNNIFKNNLIENNFYGFVGHASKNETVERNIFQNNQYHIYLPAIYRNFDLNVVYNNFRTFFKNGIYIAADLERFTFNDNTIEKIDKTVIKSDSGLNVTYSMFNKNKFLGTRKQSEQYAFYTFGTWKHNVFKNNYFKNINMPFRFFNHISFCLIEENVADDINTFSLIRYNSEYNKIKSNRINNSKEVVFSQEGSAVMNDYANNEISNNSKGIFDFSDKTNIVIKGDSSKIAIGWTVSLLDIHGYVIKTNYSEAGQRENWKKVVYSTQDI